MLLVTYIARLLNVSGYFRLPRRYLYIRTQELYTVIAYKGLNCCTLMYHGCNQPCYIAVNAPELAKETIFHL